MTSLKYRDGLTLGVGTSTGHVLLYDLRNGLPVRIKDHQYDLPIKDLAFHEPLDLVLSMDCKIVKLWDRHTVRGLDLWVKWALVMDGNLIPNTVIAELALCTMWL